MALIDISASGATASTGNADMLGISASGANSSTGYATLIQNFYTAEIKELVTEMLLSTTQATTNAETTKLITEVIVNVLRAQTAEMMAEALVLNTPVNNAEIQEYVAEAIVKYENARAFELVTEMLMLTAGNGEDQVSEFATEVIVTTDISVTIAATMNLTNNVDVNVTILGPPPIQVTSTSGSRRRGTPVKRQTR